MRQGCPLSPTLFNIVFSDVEKEMRNAQEGGVRIGRKKIFSLSCADNVILLANNDTGMREMLKRFRQNIEKKGLELNIEKSKVMEFRKNGGRRKVTVFEWRDERIEEVKDAMYLGYKLQSDNGDGKHIRYITGKANAVVGKIWSLGERKFKEDRKKRMRIFDALIKSIMCYGVEVWGWKRK